MNGLRLDDLDRLISALYETALQPTLWPQWFSTAATTFSGSSGMSLVQIPQSGTVDILGVKGFSPHALQLYADYYHQCDLWALRGRGKLARANTSADLCTDEIPAPSEP
ncbi:MAG: hypothetical protein AB7F22_18120 [Reyranella sp.]|uniref:hypothetical protein n=1 Tax=Reyranella sp. TaxID=1929291 RepID=UPI003D0B4233